MYIITTSGKVFDINADYISEDDKEVLFYRNGKTEPIGFVDKNNIIIVSSKTEYINLKKLKK